MYYKKVATSIKRIMLAFMLISVCLHTNVNAQDITTINLEKPGILKKVLKKLGKQEPLSVTHLKITGEINDKDIEILNQMSNLVYLDGSGMKGDYLDLSSFTKLEHLSLPCYTDNYDLLRGVINSHLKCLELPEYRGNIFKLFIDYKGDFIEKVYITDKQGILESRRLEEDRKFYGLKKGSNREYEQRYNRIKVDTLYVPNVKALYSWTTLHRFDPCYVVLQAENQIILNKWKQTETKKIVDLQGISLIMPYAFDGIDNIEKIIYPEYMEEIPDYAFYGCKNLKEVVLKNIKKTGRNIFENTKVKSITFPQTLEELDLCTFKKSVVDEVEFLGQYPPSMTGEGYWRNDLGGIKFQIPTKTLSSYQIGNWKNLVLVEKGENSTFEISLETPGTMEKHLSDEIIANARTLIVKGILYDTDFDVLKKCKNIQTLDLSNSFICKSPETIENEEAKQAFIRGMLGYVTKMTVEDSEKQYKEGRIDAGQHVSTNLLAEAIRESLNESANKTVASNPNCIIPESGFRDWTFIKEIKLPLLLENVSGMSGCKFLEKVIIPESAKSIDKYAFAACKNLKEINFPATLEHIGLEAFKDCSSLYHVDLSNTRIVKLENVFNRFASSDEVSLELFNAPKNLKKFEGVPEINIAYFYTREAPESENLREIKELHIPKGSRAGWSNETKYMEKVIDDIQ